MLAVISTGGKQYKVEPGAVITTEKLDFEPGSSFDVSEVLLVSDGGNVTVGRPLVAGATVKCEVVRHFRGKKLIAFKKWRRKGKTVKKGHRQDLTEVRVKSINL